jgi:hypothetical protein
MNIQVDHSGWGIAIILFILNYIKLEHASISLAGFTDAAAIAVQICQSKFSFVKNI